jgi:myo-inositol-1(or 4)-monophosphatase
MTLGAEEASALRARLEPSVRRAGDLLLASFERLEEVDVRHKGAVDLVTRLDLEAQALLVHELESAFPGDQVVAEEAAPAGSSLSGRVWLLDPLDGTTNYVHGQPPFAVSVALVSDGRPTAGMVYAPYLREMFWAGAGCGAYLGERRLRVSRRRELDGALLATGFPYDVRTNPHNNLREWAHLALRCRGLRRGGAASLDLAYVAAGRLDGYWEFRLKPWDLAAGALLVLEAGGCVTGPDGGGDFLASGDLVATNGLLHTALRATLAEVGPAPARRSEPGGGGSV